MKPFQIHSRIYQIGGPDITTASDCCIYLLDGGSELAVIDAGAGSNTSSLLLNIKQLGFDPPAVKYVVATHCHIDHIGGLAYLKEKLSARIAAHILDLPAIEGKKIRLTAAFLYGVLYKPVTVDVVIKGDEETLDVGDLKLVCPHTPGHTPGGISPYVDVEGKRILFGQDIHGPFNSSWGSDMTDWRKSMEKLLDLNCDILCEGHFGIYQPRQEARRYIEGYMDRYAGTI